jgi:hypothetical protein
MAHTFFSAAAYARSSGFVEKVHTLDTPDQGRESNSTKLRTHPQGSVEFVFTSDYPNGQFSFIPDYWVFDDHDSYARVTAKTARETAVIPSGPVRARTSPHKVKVVLMVNNKTVSEALWGESACRKRGKPEIPLILDSTRDECVAFAIPNDPTRWHSFRELTIDLQKGINTISIANKDANGGILDLKSILIISKVCDRDAWTNIFYAHVCHWFDDNKNTQDKGMLASLPPRPPAATKNLSR